MYCKCNAFVPYFRSYRNKLITVNTRILQALIDAGAVKKIELIANGPNIHALIHTQTEKTVLLTNKREIKIWVSFDTAVKWIKAKGVAQLHLDARAWQPNQRKLQL